MVLEDAQGCLAPTTLFGKNLDFALGGGRPEGLCEFKCMPFSLPMRFDEI